MLIRSGSQRINEHNVHNGMSVHYRTYVQYEQGTSLEDLWQ